MFWLWMMWVTSEQKQKQNGDEVEEDCEKSDGCLVCLLSMLNGSQNFISSHNQNISRIRWRCEGNFSYFLCKSTHHFKNYNSPFLTINNNFPLKFFLWIFAFVVSGCRTASRVWQLRLWWEKAPQIRTKDMKSLVIYIRLLFISHVGILTRWFGVE